MKKKKFICSKCLTKKVLVKHHLYNHESYKRRQHEEDVLLICESCRNELVAILPTRRLDKDQYQSITFAFMRGYDITVV